MKTFVFPISFFFLLCLNYLNAQDTTLLNYQLPEASEYVKIRLENSNKMQYGHLFHATTEGLSILNSTQLPTEQFELITIPASNLRHITFETQFQRDGWLGAAFGMCVGVIAGAVWASNVDVPECDHALIFFCENSEERNEARKNKLRRFTGATVLGTLGGALIGAPSRLIIPINGKQTTYEKELAKIKQFTILQN